MKMECCVCEIHLSVIQKKFTCSDWTAKSRLQLFCLWIFIEKLLKLLAQTRKLIKCANIASFPAPQVLPFFYETWTAFEAQFEHPLSFHTALSCAHYGCTCLPIWEVVKCGSDKGEDRPSPCSTDPTQALCLSARVLTSCRPARSSHVSSCCLAVALFLVRVSELHTWGTSI